MSSTPSGMRTAFRLQRRYSGSGEHAQAHLRQAGDQQLVVRLVPRPASLQALLQDQPQALVEAVERVDRRGVMVGAVLAPVAADEGHVQDTSSATLVLRVRDGLDRAPARRRSAPGPAGCSGTSACRSSRRRCSQSSTLTGWPPSEVTQSTTKQRAGLVGDLR